MRMVPCTALASPSAPETHNFLRIYTASRCREAGLDSFTPYLPSSTGGISCPLDIPTYPPPPSSRPRQTYLPPLCLSLYFMTHSVRIAFFFPPSARYLPTPPHPMHVSWEIPYLPIPPPPVLDDTRVVKESNPEGGDKVTILRLATRCVRSFVLSDNGSASSQRRSLDSLRASLHICFKPSLACSPLIIAWLNHLLLVKLPPKSSF